MSDMLVFRPRSILSHGGAYLLTVLAALYMLPVLTALCSLNHGFADSLGVSLIFLMMIFITYPTAIMLTIYPYLLSILVIQLFVKGHSRGAYIVMSVLCVAPVMLIANSQPRVNFGFDLGMLLSAVLSGFIYDFPVRKFSTRQF